MALNSSTLRVAAVGDIHCTASSQGLFHRLFRQVTDQADVLLLPGDLTDYGLPDEAQVLAKELTGLSIPIVGVLGNHDFQSGRQDEVKKILTDAGVSILDGEAREIGGVGFAGVKGFCGGFGRSSLQPWGEEIIKAFVRESVNESLKLESALAKLRAKRKIVVLHYAPIQSTVEREPVEIFAYLGSDRLADPIDRYDVTAVFHGHAHHGTLQGKTRAGVPVFNVALPLLRQELAGRPPIFLYEVQKEEVLA